jgi:micrococcal nuclease|tara:strand:+ start:1088 stop:1513 length:426 start_codon:yes stop_codon:yes gene_type:complete
MSNPYIFTATVSKIVDGDTMYVTDINLGFGIYHCGDTGRGICLRLNGIDTQESRTRDLEEKKYGLAAKEFVKAFCPVGSKVTLRTYEKGKYGRWLADIKVGSKWLCKELLKNHHAVEYHGKSKKDIKKAHLANRKLVKLSG